MNYCKQPQFNPGGSGQITSIQIYSLSHVEIPNLMVNQSALLATIKQKSLKPWIYVFPKRQDKTFFWSKTQQNAQIYLYNIYD